MVVQRVTRQFQQCLVAPGELQCIDAAGFRCWSNQLGRRAQAQFGIEQVQQRDLAMHAIALDEAAPVRRKACWAPRCRAQSQQQFGGACHLVADLS